MANMSQLLTFLKINIHSYDRMLSNNKHVFHGSNTTYVIS